MIYHLRMNIITIIILTFISSFSVCLTDISRREIPNKINIALLALNSILSIYLGYFNCSVIVFFVLLILFSPLWFLGYFGGGDLKLLCVFSIAIHPIFSLLYIALIGLIGGVQIIIMAIYYKMMNKNMFENGIPYGIPISISGFSFCVISALYIGF